MYEGSQASPAERRQLIFPYYFAKQNGGFSRRDGRTECNGGLESPDVAKRNRRAPPGLSAPLTGGGRSRRLRLRSFFLLSNEQKK